MTVPSPRISLLLLLCAASLRAAPPSPAHWTLIPQTQKVAPGGEFIVELRLSLDEPWHMYSPTTPKPGPSGGPIPTTLALAESPAIAAWSLYYPPPKKQFDPNFQLDTETYEKETAFYFKIRLAPAAPAGPLELTAQTRFQLCNDKECLPPRRVTATASVDVAPGAPAAAVTLPGGLSLFQPASGASPAAPAPLRSTAQAQSLGAFLTLAFGLGLAAIFTPCVFPMIPITMSFFLNQEAHTRGQAVAQAVVFCFGIVALFTGIGFVITAALGPFGVVQLGSSPWVNAFIVLVFFAFALSLLGAFEITLPSGLLTKLNSASGRGGYLGVLLMGLTFSLTSFACVGPFVGTLLAASVQGNKLQPALGMLAFSSGLAAPFFLLALFPSYLRRLPRSGGWMARVKIVMGFLILAAMLKYLSNIDAVLQWNVLTRERFLAFWIVLFALPGLYLLGFLRMEGIKAEEKVGPGRLLVGVLLLGASISFIPGMFGTRLGEVEAFIPAPAEGSALSGTATGNAALHWEKNHYTAALARARAENKLLLVSFTGYACTNCHWMEANMFPRPEIAAALSDFVLVELYTDGTDATSEENQKRQESRFQTVAIPFYAILDGQENVVATFAGLTKDPQQFLAFLKSRPAGA
jgi:thiol:disulfide interchange protein